MVGGMSSSYRDTLNAWLSKLDVSADSVLDAVGDICYYGGMKKNGSVVKCNWCGTDVYKSKSHLENHQTYHCSQGCRLKALNHNRVPWNKGTTGIMKPNSGSFKRGIRASVDTEFKPRQHAFTGTISEYKYIHYKVGVAFGKPGRCEDCGTDNLVGRKIHWANTTGIYNTDRKNWRRLCVRCHAIFDGRVPSV
jgi:hypothetical protein